MMIKEYEPTDKQAKALEIMSKCGLACGRMISGSKSGYMSRYPEHLVIFNANVITEKFGKIWYGDLDIDVDAPALKEAANMIGEPLYVLYEMDARFDKENRNINALMADARVVIRNDKK